MGKFGSAVKNSAEGLNWLLVLGFLGIVWLMIYGNLSGNLGFVSKGYCNGAIYTTYNTSSNLCQNGTNVTGAVVSDGSTGYIDSQSVITNVTKGANTFFSYSNTLFTIMAIVLLITILLALLYIVMGIVRMNKAKRKGESEKYEGNYSPSVYT